LTGGAGRGFGRGVLRAGFTVNGNDGDISNDMAGLSVSKPGGMTNGFGKSENGSGGRSFGSRGGFGSGGFGDKSNDSGSGGGFKPSGGFAPKREGGGGFGSQNNQESSGSGGGKCRGFVMCVPVRLLFLISGYGCF
jgi:hypothetical protein